MQIPDTQMVQAQTLNRAIIKIAEETAFHQWPKKITQEIIGHGLNTPTLATATASLQGNSQISDPNIEHVRSLMKVMLDSQILNDQLDAQAALADLMERQIETQVKFSAASDKQAGASRFLGWVNIGLAAAAFVLAAVQAGIAMLVNHG